MQTAPLPSAVVEEEKDGEADISQPQQLPEALPTLSKTVILSPPWFLPLLLSPRQWAPIPGAGV